MARCPSTGVGSDCGRSLRSGALSREQVGDLLGLSFWETETFLKQHQAYLAYDAADLEEDRATLKRILSQ